MEKISDNINRMFETLFKTDNHQHPFFKDLFKVNSISHEYNDRMIKFITKKIKHNPHIKIPDGVKTNPVYDILDITELKKLDREINDIMNFKKILNIVSYISQYIIKSNITNEDKLYKNLEKESHEKLNIMIIGFGPVGLFLACYLHLYYNETSMASSPRVNIVMYDSRIEKPGFRKPYNRQRLFGTSSRYLSLIIPKLFCWDDTKSNIFMVNIFILEYILFTVANTHYNIPMIYEDYSWDDYKKIIDKGKFHVVFDCTGGKLTHDAIKNINPAWIKKIDLHNEKLNRKISVIPEKNLVLIEHDSNHIKNYFYGSMNFSYNNKYLTFYSKYDIDIMNKEDLIFFNNLKDKYFSFKEAAYIIQGIHDDTTRNFLNSVLNENLSDFLVSFDVWGIYMRHAIKISDVFTVNKRNVLFIGAGDTIFHSHFITGAGLNRIFDFTVKCANLLVNIK